MKKQIGLQVTAFLCLLGTLFSAFTLNTDALDDDRYSWYCKHEKDHKRPQIASELAFIEMLGGVYLDPNVSESGEEKVVYLTFDAGYENGNVAKVLDALSAENVQATFFVLSHLIQKEPELVKRMVAEGHLVANHTAHHKDMSWADRELLMKEITDLEECFFELTGEKMAHYYRPPEGRFSKDNLECLKENGYQTVFWSFAYPDWDNHRQMPADKAKNIILQNLHNGAVMLLHPTSVTNAIILRDVIREAKSQGYRFERIDRMGQSGHIEN